jgi:hypothetical protein
MSLKYANGNSSSSLTNGHASNNGNSVRNGNSTKIKEVEQLVQHSNHGVNQIIKVLESRLPRSGHVSLVINKVLSNH